MWIKFVLCVLIVAFCTFLGYLAAGRYRSRKKFYAQMAFFNEKYINELTYTRRSLGELIDETQESGDFYRLLKNHAQKNKPIPEFGFLTKEENRECAEYLSMLGAGDSVSQKNYYSSRRQGIEGKKTESESSAAQRNGLYVKLGLLAGLAFVILII